MTIDQNPAFQPDESPIAVDPVASQLAIPEVLADELPPEDLATAEALPARRRLYNFADHGRAPSLGPNRSMFGAD